VQTQDIAVDGQQLVKHLSGILPGAVISEIAGYDYEVSCTYARNVSGVAQLHMHVPEGNDAQIFPVHVCLMILFLPPISRH
jgi:hypothetical protein